MEWDEHVQHEFAYENDYTEQEEEEEEQDDSCLNFDIFSSLSKLKDYYGILELDCDATEDAIRSNYIRLALRQALKFQIEKEKHFLLSGNETDWDYFFTRKSSSTKHHNVSVKRSSEK